MSAPASKVLVNLRDSAGKTCQWTFFVPFTTDPASTAVMNVIDGLIAYTPLEVLNHQLEEEAGVSAGTAATGYYTGMDKILVTMRNSVTGQLYKHELPAPKNATFLSDGETMDPAGPGASTLRTVLEANVVGTNGESCTFVKAKRSFGKRKIHSGT